MTTSINVLETPEAGQQMLDKIKTARKAAKKKRRKAKNKFSKAKHQDANHSELHILDLKHQKAKHKHKALKATYRIAKHRLKNADKSADTPETNIELPITRATSPGKAESKKHLKKHAQKAGAMLPAKVKDKKHAQKDVARKEKKEKKSIDMATNVKPTVPTPALEKTDKQSSDQKVAKIEKQSHQIAPHPQNVSKASIESVKTETIKSKTVLPPVVPKVQTVAVEKVPKISESNLPKVETSFNYASNDLTLIEGIGKKVAEILNTFGISTFKSLATADVDDLKTLLRKNRLQMINPTTWTEQAQLIVNGKFDELKTLQNVLKGGKRV